MGGLGISISAAFVYRLAAITQTIPRLHNKRNITIMVLIHICYTFPVIAFALYVSNSDKEAVLTDIKKVRYFSHNFKSLCTF
jgi:hypothetical protein